MGEAAIMRPRMTKFKQFSGAEDSRIVQPSFWIRIQAGGRRNLDGFVGSSGSRVRHTAGDEGGRAACVFNLLWGDRPRTHDLRTCEPTNPDSHGSAKTNIELVACGMRASGIVSVTMLLDHDPPPVPTGTATYCFPFTA